MPSIPDTRRIVIKDSGDQTIRFNGLHNASISIGLHKPTIRERLRNVYRSMLRRAA